MIFGIGNDLCDIRRIAASLAERGERFAAQVLTPPELAQWQDRSTRNPERGVRFVATRFAAKEALAKALGLGMQEPMGWQQCTVVTLPSGQPGWQLHGSLAQWCADRQLRLHLSISDEADYAACFCVAEQCPPVLHEGG